MIRIFTILFVALITVQMITVSYAKRHLSGISLVAAWTCQDEHHIRRLGRGKIRAIETPQKVLWSPINFPSQPYRSYSNRFRFFSTIYDEQHSHHKVGDSTTSEISTEEAIYQDLQWLSREIRRHDELYYSQQPELSDDEFDALVQREEKLGDEYPLLLQRLQEESGLGVAATRKGRVGEYKEIAAPIQTDKFLQKEPRLKRKHLSPMLSLDNVNNNEQLWAWLKRIPKVLDEWDAVEPTRVTIITEPKLDGVSLSLRYQRQEKDVSEPSYELQWATTRGDGQQGQDVTPAVLFMKETIPSHFTTKHTYLPNVIEIRGEVVLPNKAFESLTAMIPNATFTNARNAASGILLRKDSGIESDRIESQQLRSKLRFYAYEMVGDPQEQRMAFDGNVVQDMLAEIGFSIPLPVAKTDFDLISTDTMNDWSNETIAPMLSYYHSLQAHRDEQKATKGFDWGDFEMDGCVHKVAQYQIRQLLGRSMKSPKWAVAHKFPPRAVVTKLLDISVQVGRTGALTPVAILEPVEVGGVTIQRATLHNFGHLQQIFGGSEAPIGTSVLVRRAGDVIPQIVQRVGEPHSTIHETMISLEAPTRCPACGSPVIVEDVASLGIGQVIRCGGPPLLCPPRSVTSMAHAFSRDAMDVSGLSEARIQQLIDAGLIRFPGDIFQFGDEEWNQVQELPGWGPKSCQNLRSACQHVASTGISLSRFIYCLGIRHLGKHSSELVAGCYTTKEGFLGAIDAAVAWTEPDSEDEVQATTHPFSALQGQLGIGPVLLQSLMSFAKNKELVGAAKDLGKAIMVTDEEQGVETPLSDKSRIDEASKRRLPWKGFRVVFTGSIPGFSRTEAQKCAKLLGAKATPTSVSKSTDLVVVGEKGGKKLAQAQSFGTQIMSAEEFASLVQDIIETTD